MKLEKLKFKDEKPQQDNGCLMMLIAIGAFWTIILLLIIYNF